MTILYELFLFEEEAYTLSSSSFAKIDILYYNDTKYANRQRAIQNLPSSLIKASFV